MDKYLEILSKIKSNGGEWTSLFDKIEQYIKGEISSQELMLNTDETAKGVIYNVINKLINYTEKEVRYFIELPQDKFFNTIGQWAIIAGKTQTIGISYDLMETIGPNYMKMHCSGFVDKKYIEIEGDFSTLPNGVMLYQSDWYRIISKYPYLLELMHYLSIHDYYSNSDKDISLEEEQKRINEIINRYINLPKDKEPNSHWIGKEEAQYLPQEVIDSINFVIPIEYLRREQIISGQFGTFKELLSSQNTSENEDMNRRRK